MSQDKLSILRGVARILASAVICAAAAAALANLRHSQRAAIEPSQIELRLSISTKAFRAGDEPPTLRVELHNHSSQPFYSSSLLDPEMSAPAYLLLEGTNTKGERFRLWQLNITGVVPRWWNRVEPSHFYGTEYKLNPDEFSFLKTPDRYRISAIYVSGGGSTPPNPEWNLPSYNIWKGTLRSNTAELEVIAPRKDDKP